MTQAAMDNDTPGTLEERLRVPLPEGMCGQSMGCNAASICLCSHIEDQRELLTEAADEIARLYSLARANNDLARRYADEIASLRARVEALEAALASEREDNLWNAYHSGHVKDGEWDHMCMSDGEWLAHECGFNVKDRRIADADIRAAIPEAARQALKDMP